MTIPRMHPPVPMITRKCVAPIELEGYSLPAGTYVAAGACNVHCREETFPEPYAFRPERFVNKAFSPFEYLPYGGGHRRCLGPSFAGFELCMVLATMLRRAEFSLAEPKPVEHVLRIGTFGPATGGQAAKSVAGKLSAARLQGQLRPRVHGDRCCQRLHSRNARAVRAVRDVCARGRMPIHERPAAEDGVVLHRQS